MYSMLLYCFMVINQPHFTFHEDGQGNLLDLVVEVYNIKDSEGQILLALYNEQLEFLGDDILTEGSAQVQGMDEVTIHLRGLTPGKYAISVYHDVNSNHQLDTKIFGIPKEPYGFSNDARKTFRAPRFDEAVFELRKHGQVERIRVK